MKKIECKKDGEATKQKRAQRFIKNSVAESLAWKTRFEHIFLSLSYNRPSSQRKPHRAHKKAQKCRFSLLLAYYRR